MVRQALVLDAEDMVKVQQGRFLPPAGIQLADLKSLLKQVLKDAKREHGPDAGIVQLTLHADYSVEAVVTGDGWEKA
jgi:hypothetical protein